MLCMVLQWKAEHSRDGRKCMMSTAATFTQYYLTHRVSVISLYDHRMHRNLSYVHAQSLLQRTITILHKGMERDESIY